MRFLELNEIWEWCEERGIGVENRTSPARNPHLSHVTRARYELGTRTGHEAALADVCVRALGDWDECLLWITLVGVWDSDEDWPAFYAMRGERGERRSVEIAPGHCFRCDERALLVRFLTAVFENGWDAFLLPTCNGRETDRRLQVSHDEWVEVQSRRPVEPDALAV